jgi:integrase
MILMRAVAAFGADHPIDRLTGPDPRAWLVELRTTLAPVSVAGYVRTLKAFGNWLQAEELAEASGLRALRKPRVPDKLIEPVPDDTLRRLLGLATVRDRAILLLLLDTGLRVSEAAGIRLGDRRGSIEQALVGLDRGVAVRTVIAANSSVMGIEILLARLSRSPHRLPSNTPSISRERSRHTAGPSTNKTRVSLDTTRRRRWRRL